MEGIATILIMWPLCSLAAVVGICWLFASWGRPKRRVKRRPAAAPPVIKVIKPRQPAVSPSYLRRWNLNRRWWVVSEKAAWKDDFDRLLREAPVPPAPEPAAAPRPAQARPAPAAEPPAPPADTSKVFRTLRERLDSLS
jgi:hypothetical protein